MPIGFVGPALQGASFISRFGVPLLQQAGIGLGISGLGALANSASKTPSQSNAQVRNRRANVGRNDNSYSGIIGSIPPSANGESYRSAELRLGNRGGSSGNAGYSVPTFRPLGGTPEERAQAAETSRIAQMTAQDPELQRYERARQMAVAPGAMPDQIQSAEDIGMQIWQQKYGNTPMGQPGGAVGVFNPLMQRTFGYQTGSAPGQQMGEPTLGPSPLMPQVDQALNPASPNYLGGEGSPLINFADPRFENASPEDFEKLLKQVNKK